MTLRLKRHDELVEKIRLSIDNWFFHSADAKAAATAALDALLEAAVRLNVGGVVYDADGNCRNHIILRMEASDDE